MADRNGQIQWQRDIPAPPSVIVTDDDTVNGFLASLPTTDLTTVANTKAEWALSVTDDYTDPSGFDNAGSAWIVSAETLKRIRSKRFA